MCLKEPATTDQPTYRVSYTAKNDALCISLMTTPMKKYQLMCVYPLEGQVTKDHWAGSRSWPTRSSVWFESLPRLHHRSHHRKELASPPVHWPPTHRINTHTQTHTAWLIHRTQRICQEQKLCAGQRVKILH